MAWLRRGIALAGRLAWAAVDYDIPCSAVAELLETGQMGSTQRIQDPSNPASRPEAARFVVPLRRVDQACCAGLLVAAMIAMVGTWLYQGGLRGRVIDVERARPGTVRFQLDVNRAEWPEWSLLPGIGEMLAKRIVHSRQTSGSFQCHEDLLRVRGIGPRTLERIRPFLLPVEPAVPDS
jgi:competence protein ComEA